MHYSQNCVPPNTDPLPKHRFCEARIHIFARASGKLVMTNISDEIGRTLGRNIFGVRLCRYPPKKTEGSAGVRPKEKRCSLPRKRWQMKGRTIAARSLTGKKKREHLTRSQCMYDLRRVDADVCIDCKKSNHDWKNLSEMYKIDTMVIIYSCSPCSPSSFFYCTPTSNIPMLAVGHTYSIFNFEFYQSSSNNMLSSITQFSEAIHACSSFKKRIST